MSRKKKKGRFPNIKERKGVDKTDIKIKINNFFNKNSKYCNIFNMKNEKIFSSTN